MASVANMRHHPALRAALDHADEHGDAVRIDRRTRWGNPFRMGKDGDRAQVIERYRVWLWQRIESGEIALEDLARLNSKVLFCHCHPLPCHGTVLARAASWAQAKLEADTGRSIAAPGAPAPVYAGVGARGTPEPVLARMRDLARVLGERGWRLRTGGAQGADDAFAAAAPSHRREVYIPWRGYNGWDGSACRVLAPDEIEAMRRLAEPHHPAWERCSARVRDLHARNVAVLLGPDLRRPANAVLCWTRNGQDVGGTGMAIRLARHRRIPVLNLAEVDPREAIRRLDAIAAAPAPAPERRQAEAQDAPRPAGPRNRDPGERAGEAARPRPDTSDRDSWPEPGEEEIAARQTRPGGRRRSIRP